MKRAAVLVVILMSLFSHALHALNSNNTIKITTENPLFTIQLPSNPTTGYRWMLQQYDARLIIPVNHAYQRARTSLIGAPGVEVWKFKAKPAFFAKDATNIHMVYVRPWRGGGKGAERTFHIEAQH